MKIDAFSFLVPNLFIEIYIAFILKLEMPLPKCTNQSYQGDILLHQATSGFNSFTIE